MICLSPSDKDLKLFKQLVGSFLTSLMFIFQTMRAGDVVCTRVYERDWRILDLGSFYSIPSQPCPQCAKMLVYHCTNSLFLPLFVCLTYTKFVCQRKRDVWRVRGSTCIKMIASLHCSFWCIGWKVYLLLLFVHFMFQFHVYATMWLINQKCCGNKPFYL